MPGNRFVAMAVLALLWGSSFIFIRVEVRDLDPGEVLASRMALGALTLAPFVLTRFGLREGWARLRPIWPKVVAMGVVTFFVPTSLLAWGEQRIDAGLTAILIAGAPLWAAALSLRIAPHESVRGRRLVGLFVGFAGVALLVGAQPSGDMTAALAVALVGIFYALATLLAGIWLSPVPPLLATFGIFCFGSLAVIPVALAGRPGSVSGDVVVAMLAFGIVSTGFGFLFFVSLVARWGAAFAVLVNYLSPAVTLLLGAIFLNEQMTWSKLGGLAVVLVGVALASDVRFRGRVRPRRPGQGGMG
jgi:drug/metabolite transporter (DMT)-like permease